MLCEPIPEAGGERKKRKLLPLEMFIYGIFLPAVLFAHPHRNSLLAYALALFLSLSMVGTMIALAVMAARRTDEFQRKVLTQAMLWGTGGTLAINTVSGLLEFFTDAPQLPVLASFPIFLVIFMTAKAMLFRRYRVDHE
jgi:predicted permease